MFRGPGLVPARWGCCVVVKFNLTGYPPMLIAANLRRISFGHRGRSGGLLLRVAPPATCGRVDGPRTVHIKEEAPPSIPTTSVFPLD